jgi:predicted RNA-binding protein (virulence factor B family)
VKQQILEAIEGSPDGIIPIGDKSSPQDISSYLHGVSKADFRKAVGSLYKEHVVVPEDFELRLLPSEERASVPATNIDINKIR